MKKKNVISTSGWYGSEKYHFDNFNYSFCGANIMYSNGFSKTAYCEIIRLTI